MNELKSKTNGTDVDEYLVELVRNFESPRPIQDRVKSSFISTQWLEMVGFQVIVVGYSYLHSKIRSERAGIDKSRLKYVGKMTLFANLVFIVGMHLDLAIMSSLMKFVYNTSHLYSLSHPNAWISRRIFFPDEKLARFGFYCYTVIGFVAYMWIWRQIRFVGPLVPIYLIGWPYLSNQVLNK